LTSFLQTSSEDAKQIYGRMWLYTFAIAEKFPDYVQVFGEYTENPASILEETIKHIKSKLQTLYDVDDEFIIYLTRLSLENYIEFDGTSYLGLKAFQQAVEEFVHPEMENKQFVTIFMITFEKKRDSHLKAICEIISNKLFDTYELKDLNIFQKNRVAKIFEEQYAKYLEDELEDELVDDWEELEESFEAYDDIADYLPELELEEIVKILSER
jgi:dGTP triphosphohydrolase